MNQKEDCIKVIEAILIGDHSASGFGGEESYDRQAIFFDINKITITEDCYFHSDQVDRVYKYNVSIKSNGEIIITLLSQERRAEDNRK